YNIEKYNSLVEQRRAFESSSGNVSWTPRDDFFPAYLS
ncbi:hypothetical protein LCGC14_2337070, partial [marine sediment metagenome]